MKKSTKVLSAAMMVLMVAGTMTSCKNGWNNPFSTDEKDTIPPTITAYSRQVEIGDTLNLMQDVTAKKDGKIVTIDVDKSQLNYNVAGDYDVTYIAHTEDGDSAKKTVTIHVFDPHKKVIYLTFDDGPSKNTPQLLQILKEYGVHATFFVTGCHVDYVKYIKKEAEEGHAIAAHTYSHEFPIYTSFKTYFDDLEKIEKVIEQQTGHRTNIIRFPGGSSNHVFSRYNADPAFMVKLCDEVQKRGYQYMDWNCSNGDASANCLPVSTLIANACHEHAGEMCMLMHDSPAKTTTVEALPTIIDFFKSRGYDFRTITSTGLIVHHDAKPYIRPSKNNKKNDTTSVASNPNRQAAGTNDRHHHRKVDTPAVTPTKTTTAPTKQTATPVKKASEPATHPSEPATHPSEPATHPSEPAPATTSSSEPIAAES